MALNVEVGHIVQPGATGNQTTNLPASFDPKALILVATPLAADGVTAHASMCVGFATDRGGTPQQRCTGVFAEDNIGTSDTYRWNDDDDVLQLVDAAGAIDMSVSFVEFTTTTFVLNWTNLHTTASIRVNYMVLGGSDLEDAEAHGFSLTTGAGAFDVALGSGFGHPNLVLFMRCADAADSGVISGADFGLGFGVLGGDDRSVWWGSQDNAATEASFQRVDNDSALVAGANGTIETDITLAAEAGFPTDGYEVTKATSSFASEGTNALALKFSSNVTIAAGGVTMRTTTGDTDLAVGTSTPKGLILLHTRQTTAGSTDSTSSDAAELGIGLVDGAGNERWAGIWDDDGQATASVASSAQVDDKALRVYTPSTDALDGEADGTVSGSNFRLSYADPMSAAFLGEWVAVGEAAAGGTDYPLNADPGTYTVTGTAAATIADRQITAAPATVTVTGTAAAIVAGRVVTADPTAYTLNGTAAGVLADRAVPAVPGSYTVTGNAAIVAAGWLFNADPAAYTLTGTAADLLYEQPGLFDLNADPGSYTLTGAATALLAARLLNLDPSTITVTGTDAAIPAGRAIQAEPATVTLTGLAATVPATHLITGTPATYTITGITASLLAAGQAASTAALRITFREPSTPSAFQEPGGLIHREHSATFREGT